MKPIYEFLQISDFEAEKSRINKSRTARKLYLI